MSWNGLRTSLRSVDLKMFSIIARDISVTGSNAITELYIVAFYFDLIITKQVFREA